MGGIYALQPGLASLVLADGSDATMDVALVPVDFADAAGLNAGAEKAVRFWSRSPSRRVSGGVLSAGNTHFQLDFSKNRGRKVYPLQAPREGLYVLLTEHRPAEYALAVEDATGNVLARRAEQFFGAGHSHDETVTSVGIHLEGEVDPHRLNAWLSKLLQEQGADIFRMKGILAIAGQKNRYAFQGVHMLFEGQPDRPWGKTSRANDLVFIGRKLDREALTERFRRCR